MENEELVQINRRLSAIENGEVGNAQINAELALELERAAAVYRHETWPTDEQADREFLSRINTLVLRYGGELAESLVRVYETHWPSSPIRVDVATYAGPFGAYTMLEPAHITIASSDRRHVGDAALEVLFHEASHVLISRVEASIARACAAQRKPVPPSLWHALIFYATGEATRRLLGTAYVPYAYQNGLYRRSDEWTRLETTLAGAWPAFEQGHQSLDATIDQLVTSLSSEGEL